MIHSLEQCLALVMGGRGGCGLDISCYPPLAQNGVTSTTYGKLSHTSERILILNIFIHSVSLSKFSARHFAFISSCGARDKTHIPATASVVADGKEIVVIKGCWGNVFGGKRKTNSKFREEIYKEREDDQ